MLIKNNHLTAIIVLLASYTLLFGQSGEEDFANLNYSDNVKKSGTSAAPFLEIGIGARAQAMGAAYAAVSDDAAALYWNPAGLSLAETVSITANHSEWFVGTTYQYFGLLIPVGNNSAIGFSLSSMDYGDKQPVRTIMQPEGTGEYYDASDVALGASYGMKLTDNFAFGGSVKYIKQTIWHESAETFALDLGIRYDTEFDGLSIGASLSNFGGDMKLEGRDLVRAYDADEENYSNDKLNVNLQTDEFPLPLLFRFGLAYQYIATENHVITVACDLVHPSNNIVTLNSGIEYTLFNTVSLRGGYESLFDDSSEKGLTLGFGLNNPYSDVLDFSINYAYSDWGILGDIQRFSLDIKL